MLVLLCIAACFDAFAYAVVTEQINVINNADRPFGFDVTVPARAQANVEINPLSDQQPQERLWSAVENRKPAEVLTAINAGADVNEKDCRGNTPLHYAAWEGNAEIIQLLINAGSLINEKNSADYTPLHFAATNGNIDSVRLLINAGADINQKSPIGGTPLNQAARAGHVEIVRLLINMGAHLNEKDSAERTPLHAAAERNHVEIVRLLIIAGADLNLRSDNGKRPWCWSCNQKIKQILIIAGATF